MQSEGIVRKLDELGRITIPKEIRDSLNLHEKDPVDIIPTDDGILLKISKDKEQVLKELVLEAANTDKEALMSLLKDIFNDLGERFEVG
ncbi:hypothetical protein lbkm_0651 [Lachnospiraceae bacterium KM106-2]|nr:hypothetical protein lbkm_0651 [Lachnospiraceae bacterium KM106-2]